MTWQTTLRCKVRQAEEEPHHGAGAETALIAGDASEETGSCTENLGGGAAGLELDVSQGWLRSDDAGGCTWELDDAPPEYHISRR